MRFDSRRHDFMFSCSLYPGDADFLRSCRVEAEHQVARLRNRACMALWCGNNELEQVPHEILKTEARTAAYNTLFNEVLPGVIDASRTETPYWPSSPHNPAGYEKGFNAPRAGDTHVSYAQISLEVAALVSVFRPSHHLPLTQRIAPTPVLGRLARAETGVDVPAAQQPLLLGVRDAVVPIAGGYRGVCRTRRVAKHLLAGHGGAPEERGRQHDH